MPYTERSKPQVILNKMTKSVYDSTEKDADQLYAITDINTSVERELTQAQYDALTEAEKNNGTTYYVKDSNPILLDAYPVGSIYMSVNKTNPSTLFGGTWSQIKDRFLLAAGSTYTAGSTGGKATHTLTVDEMPSHNHPLNGDCDYMGIDGTGGTAYGLLQAGKNYRWKIGQKNTGGGKAHNNMPPYLTVYVWKRTA